jgi:subtilisin family serine protease
MKSQWNFFRGFILAIFVLGIFAHGAWAGDEDRVRINIGWEPGASIAQVDAVMDRHEGRRLRMIRAIRMGNYTVPRRALAVLKRELTDGGVAAYVEEDGVRTIPRPIPSAERVPTDPMYPDQWGPPCIDAEAAWDYPALYDHPGVIVAVIDTGIDMDHPDLVNMVDDTIDFDFVNNDDDASDDEGHGTHVAGIIAAQQDNGIGVAGLINVTLMAVKGLDSSGSGFDSVLAQCIVYAAENGAKVINMSWGNYFFSNTLYNATAIAYEMGVLMVAAAGNDNISLRHYPSALPWVVGVAALSDCNTKAGYSNFGPQNVYIAAPGSSILSTVWDDTYATFDGTSMASPHVAGVAAMWFGLNPGLLPDQVRYLLLSTADDLGAPGRDDFFGWGRVDYFPWVD